MADENNLNKNEGSVENSATNNLDKPVDKITDKTADKLVDKTTDTPTELPVLSLAIKDLKVLYAAYMPFVDNGGLFIPTKKQFNMGDKISLLISLMSEDKKYPIEGKVVWITPERVHNNMAPGIGVQFSGLLAGELAGKIEKLLTNMAATTERTNTM